MRKRICVFLVNTNMSILGYFYYSLSPIASPYLVPILHRHLFFHSDSADMFTTGSHAFTGESLFNSPFSSDVGMVLRMAVLLLVLPVILLTVVRLLVAHKWQVHLSVLRLLVAQMSVAHKRQEHLAREHFTFLWLELQHILFLSWLKILLASCCKQNHILLCRIRNLKRIFCCETFEQQIFAGGQWILTWKKGRGWVRELFVLLWLSVVKIISYNVSLANTKIQLLNLKSHCVYKLQ